MRKCFLSKSLYLDGIKCLKLVWFRINAPEQIPVVDKKTQATFDFGHWIGEKAKRLFPKGADANMGLSFQKHLEKSLELLEKRMPIFEAGFISDGDYARADVLDPVKDNKWDIVEVKCGRSVADVNCHDIAFQRHCYTGAGLNINRCYVMHVAEGIAVRYTPVQDVFEKVDVTAKVEEYSEGIGEKIAGIRGAVSSKECPAICTGEHCDKPYGCVMKPFCHVA